MSEPRGLCAAQCRHLRRPGDTAKEDVQRRIILTALLVGAASSAARLVQRPAPSLYAFATAVVVAVCAAGILYILLRGPGSYATLTSFLALPIALAYLLLDVTRASTLSGRIWPAVVLLMDFLVVMGSPLWVQGAVVATTVCMLAAISAEDVVRYGLYDLARWNQDATPEVCSCSSPPCAVPASTAAAVWWMSALIFVLDFYVTRTYATRLHQQLAFMDTTVRVSEQVAALLAAYATDDARRVVAAEGKALPGALCDAYEQLLDNLDSYRVFLPDALLYGPTAVRQQQQPHSTVEEISLCSSFTIQPATVRLAPGLGEEATSVAMVFTDIQSSTELWEAHPQGMYEGLNIHNMVMRDAYSACNGYEVKTIGDSFMVAFDSAGDGVLFGLQSQLGLLRQQWPADLLSHPLCQPVQTPAGTPLWSGLRVRIGVHCGPTRIDTNPVTGRCDYFGPTVNTAARLEAVLRKGGLVAASDTAVAAVGPDGLREMGSPVVHEAGNRELKGVRESVKVFAIAPQVLALRVNVLTEPEAPAVPSVPNSPTCTTPSARQFAAFPRQSTTSQGIGGVVRSFSSTGSETADSSASAQTAAATPRFASRFGHPLSQRLQRSQGTCAAARLPLRTSEPVAVRHPVFAAAAALAADQTQGVVDAVLSACVFVTWNAARHCADHTAACRAFLGKPFRAPCHLGAASGVMLSGSVAAGRRSFATVVGGCVELSAALAEEAERCGDLALAAGAVAADCVAVGTAFGAQLWQPRGGGAALTVYCVVSAEHPDKWMLPDEERAGDAAEDVPAALFRVACAAAPGSEEHSAALAELRESRSAVAEQFASRVAAGNARVRLMPLLWEAGHPRPLAPTSPGDGPVALLQA